MPAKVSCHFNYLMCYMSAGGFSEVIFVVSKKMEKSELLALIKEYFSLGKLSFTLSASLQIVTQTYCHQK